MRVVVITDPLIPVPPRGYGGAERAASLLCEGLVRRGHEVVLLAGPGSSTKGRLVTHHAPGPTLSSRAFRKLLFQALGLAVSWNADVVHNFGRIDYLWALLRTRIPLVQRFGNPILRTEVEKLVAARASRLQLVSVSDHQRRELNGLAQWRTVFNAVDMDSLPYVETPSEEPYLAFLGRLTRNKGVHVAIEVAQRAKMKLRIAGNVPKDREDREFFETHVRPQLDDCVEWVGEVADGKAEFLGQAHALLFPIQWDEPCANVVGEALSCGTPVIALRRASTPEAITHGVSGFLCDGVDDMIAAVGRLSEVQRQACRAQCAEKMSSDRMVEEYLAIYRGLIEER